ncbi:MAG: rhomboid family intramembrane serine protease, partial [Vicingaceae bacterium]|nr:rhomboid family intramembrane serine protease [Vicingaceae bacterium]
MDKLEKNRFLIALIFPAVFVGVIGLIHLSAYSLDVSLVSYGVFPRKLSGLIGILTSPLIHADFKHLFNNSVPLIIMGAA